MGARQPNDFSHDAGTPLPRVSRNHLRLHRRVLQAQLRMLKYCRSTAHGVNTRARRYGTATATRDGTSRPGQPLDSDNRRAREATATACRSSELLRRRRARAGLRQYPGQVIRQAHLPATDRRCGQERGRWSVFPDPPHTLLDRPRAVAFVGLRTSSPARDFDAGELRASSGVSPLGARRWSISTDTHSRCAEGRTRSSAALTFGARSKRAACPWTSCLSAGQLPERLRHAGDGDPQPASTRVDAGACRRHHFASWPIRANSAQLAAHCAWGLHSAMRRLTRACPIADEVRGIAKIAALSNRALAHEPAQCQRRRRRERTVSPRCALDPSSTSARAHAWPPVRRSARVASSARREIGEARAGRARHLASACAAATGPDPHGAVLGADGFDGDGRGRGQGAATRGVRSGIAK